MLDPVTLPLRIEVSNPKNDNKKVIWFRFVIGTDFAFGPRPKYNRTWP